jgi:LuxR family transcriptional regulator, maltose regulon positive regulatory protein
VRAITSATSARAGLDVPLETKLHAPTAREGWVERPELIQYLASAAARLVLVDAPAGFGKTTLVAQWRASTLDGRPFAWVSLDSGDNDPARLWWHVVSALQRASPEFVSSEIVTALRAKVPDLAGTVLPMLVNELAALDEPVVLVLDDYHVISERGCHDQVAFLLLHLPLSAQMVVITRADPPLPLARLRAAGELTEVRARELRFTPPEAAALVYAVCAVELSEPDLASLVERTEGWPAGVYLAALSLRGHASPSAFVHQFTGDNRFIVDFLAEEVLSRQPDEVRRFLTRTAILSRFCAPLCDAVVGSANAAEIIDTLERENLFVVPLDETRRWFRYHHLFAQVLRSQLARAEPDIAPELHARASAWHRLSGSAEEAITHAQAARDLSGAVGLIAQHWFAYADSGRIATVRGWIRSLGDEQIAASPLAAHCAAWAAALSGERESARRWLPVLDTGHVEGPLPDGMQSLQSSAALLRAVFGFDGIVSMREAGATAVKLECDPASPWYALARTAFGAALYYSGELEQAAAQAEEARLSHASISLVRMMTFAVLALIAIEQGRIAQAEELARTARDIVSDPELGLSTTPQSSLAYTATGAVYAWQGRLAEAQGEFEHALRSRRRWVGISPWPTVEILLRLAPVAAELGDLPAATALLDEVRQVLTRLPDGADAQLARLDRLDRRLVGQSRAALLAEPLTERERAVLRLLRGPLSLREIGHELYLSLNTIKTHTRAIYRKLGVSDRQDAVAKGRELGLL